MNLDRGTLARIDRKLLAGLGQDETFRMVRVPVTPVKWSTWKRYCDSAGISMGRAIAMLIDSELAMTLDESDGTVLSVTAQRIAERLADREATLTRREGELVAIEQRLRRLNQHLGNWEHEVEARERRVESTSKPAVQQLTARTRIGRNERCPCGSGLKYKHCHGPAGR